MPTGSSAVAVVQAPALEELSCWAIGSNSVPSFGLPPGLVTVCSVLEENVTTPFSIAVHEDAPKGPPSGAGVAPLLVLDGQVVVNVVTLPGAGAETFSFVSAVSTCSCSPFRRSPKNAAAWALKYWLTLALLEPRL